MKLSFQFSNLLGTVYCKGNVCFNPDGQSLLSPVGNRLSLFHISSHKSETLPIESRRNFTSIAISPDGLALILINEDGEASICSMVSRSIIHRHHFRKPVTAVRFSPDGSLVAVLKESRVLICRAPGRSVREFNPLQITRTFAVAHDHNTCLDWSADGRALVVGSKDTNTRVYATTNLTNLRVVSLGGFNDSVVACFFEHNSLDVYAVSANGQFGAWECDTDLSDLQSFVPPVPNRESDTAAASSEKAAPSTSASASAMDVVLPEAEPERDQEAEEAEEATRVPTSPEDDQPQTVDSDSDEPDAIPGAGAAKQRTSGAARKKRARTEPAEQSEQGQINSASPPTPPPRELVRYKRVVKCRYRDPDGSFRNNVRVACADYHASTHMLVTGFDDGVFLIHELPQFDPVYSLRVSEHSISSLAFNRSGEWIAIASRTLGQLLVWEWKSESFALRQQTAGAGVATGSALCCAYNEDGSVLATGGEDARVRLWSTSSGFCSMTFTEHTAPVTALQFSRAGGVLVSASLDGTARAFDMARYRNFRTFSAERPVQLGSLALDTSGEIVCAGSLDSYEIYMWSMLNGRLLEVFSGHEDAVNSLAFSPLDATLVSCSSDRTMRLWSVLQANTPRETVRLSAEGLAVAFRPDGHEVAVATLNGHLTFFETQTAQQVGCIEARHDLGYARSETDKVTAKKLASNRFFTSLSYSCDGKALLAAGHSKFVCVYSVSDELLLKKFGICCNESLEGILELQDRRKLTEFGVLALRDTGLDDDPEAAKDISLPGVRRGEMSSRRSRPEVRVNCVRFSPTGRTWSAVTTEGVLLYSLDAAMVFEPFDFTEEVTISTVLEQLQARNFESALILAMRLNEPKYISLVLDSIPLDAVESLSISLPDVYVEKIIVVLARALEQSPHIEYMLRWLRALLFQRGPLLQKRAKEPQSTLIGPLRHLQKVLALRSEQLSQVCDFNCFMLKLLREAAVETPDQVEISNPDRNAAL